MCLKSGEGGLGAALQAVQTVSQIICENRRHPAAGGTFSLPQPISEVLPEKQPNGKEKKEPTFFISQTIHTDALVKGI